MEIKKCFELLELEDVRTNIIRKLTYGEYSGICRVGLGPVCVDTCLQSKEGRIESGVFERVVLDH